MVPILNLANKTDWCEVTGHVRKVLGELLILSEGTGKPLQQWYPMS